MNGVFIDLSLKTIPLCRFQQVVLFYKMDFWIRTFLKNI